jgi:1-acyl-sn-glycerol-3-phosphate acyltransferase
MTQRSWPKRLWYRYLHLVCRVLGVAACRIRVEGADRVPPTGGGLLLSNHQSHLDPVLVGLACPRRLNYLARDSLFRFAPFRWLIQSLDAIPIDREGTGLAGLKETLRRLKHEELVLLFPEGTRTADGRISPLRPGFCAIARRGRAPLVPVGIDGAFAAFPRTAPLPRPARIAVVFGEALSAARAAELSDEELVAEVERRLHAAHARARRLRRRSPDCDPTHWQLWRRPTPATRRTPKMTDVEPAAYSSADSTREPLPVTAH